MISGKAEKCCGCTACENICKCNAITMAENDKGFLEPHVDLSRCVNCGLCDTVCPLTQQTHNVAECPSSLLAAKRNDEKARSQSQSGGAFAGLAEAMLARGGVVYGVATDQTLQAVYARATNVRQLRRLKGSKYVQASVGTAFRQVQQDLQDGHWVLFSGTPCHVHGLKCYLSKCKMDMDKLICVDLICHGVPSPKLYRDYLQLCEARHGGNQVTAFNFRVKRFGWHGQTAMYRIGRKYYVNNDYVSLFHSHLCLRDSCYDCKYTNFQRPGDLTIGDCWGIEKFAKEFDDNKGCSLIFINSPKGKQLWDAIWEKYTTLPCEKQNIIQPNLVHPTPAEPEMAAFWSDYHKYGLEYVMVRYCKANANREYRWIAPTQYGQRLCAGIKYRINRLTHKLFVYK